MAWASIFSDSLQLSSGRKRFRKAFCFFVFPPRFVACFVKGESKKEWFGGITRRSKKESGGFLEIFMQVRSL